MVFPPDYIERVYAGVLGKIIGVYLGRPFEGWTHERILKELGEINAYVHEKRGVPLIVTDDDISGTFTFLRALEDHGSRLDLTPVEIGKTWLNYLIDRKTILWWGGLGNSTEHTAYLRLKQGCAPPRSGSIALNGPIVAQQIGAQIFIDGWALVSPGDPLRAADLARRAASVSHDGEAIYGAQVLAAMEAMAFVEPDINKLIDTGLSVIPKHSIIYAMISDLLDWYAADADWRKTFHRIEEHYGYKDYIGGCHMVPNHALIILGLLYGEGDFGRSLMVCNTCGWDTDCNSGNLGCLLGIRNGLAGIDAGPIDWRGPVADRMYLPTMDGGRCVTDAVRETYVIVNAARAMNGYEPILPKNGARFHFNLPGSVQGFHAETDSTTLENVEGQSRTGLRALAIRFPESDQPARVSTPTFLLPEDRAMPGYSLIASPTLYPGQILRARIAADVSNAGTVLVRLLLHYYDGSGSSADLLGPAFELAPGTDTEFAWDLPDLPGQPIYAVGVEAGPSAGGALYLDYLTWDGAARTTFAPPPETTLPHSGPRMWREAWVNAVDQWDSWGSVPFRLIQNTGRGLVTTGTREWQDYRISATLRPALLKAGGLAARVQGLLRYYALELTEAKTVRLVRVYDGETTILAEEPCHWEFWQPVDLRLEVRGSHLRAWVGRDKLFDGSDKGSRLTGGAVGFVIEEGHLMSGGLMVEPV